MAYTPTTWANGSGGATPLSAANLTNLNAGIAEASPPGGIQMYGGAAAPTGWLLCDGTSYLRATYPALFTAIGTAYGSVDGTHFNVPDLRGRVAVGLGTHTDIDALGENDGSVIGDRRPKHKHTVAGGNFLTSGGAVNYAGGATGSVQTILVGPQTNSPTDAPAYVVVNYIVKT